MKKFKIILLVLCAVIVVPVGAMEEEPDLFEDFVMIQPSEEMLADMDKEARQEYEAIQEAIKKGASEEVEEKTAWQAFKSKIAAIPRGVGYVGQVLSTLSNTRLYLDTTLQTILAEQEDKLSKREKETFKAVRKQVESIKIRFEKRLYEVGKIKDGQKQEEELLSLQDEYLQAFGFITRLQQASEYGKLSRNSLTLLLLTFLKDIRVTQLEAGLVTPLFETWAQFITDFTAELLNAATKKVNGDTVPRNPHKNDDVEVGIRKLGAISDQEKDEFLPARHKKTAAALRKILDPLIKNINVPPVNEKTKLNIGLVFSGGGYRAMTLTAGYLEALEQLGILDASLYISTLSGSTWFLAPWLLSGKSVSEFNKDLAERMPHMNIEYLGHHAFDDPERRSALNNDIILPKFAFDQPVGTVDMYGWILSQALLGGNYTANMSEQWDIIKNGAYPFPVYTAISMHKIGSGENVEVGYNWYEFNPLELENIELGYSIPIWALGRKFDKGKSLHIQGLSTYPYEQSLGYLLGIFGSAYTIDFLKDAPKKLHGPAKWLLAGLQKVVTVRRLWPAQSYNPWKGLFEDEGEKFKWLNDKEKLTFVDGGIDFNLPVLPLLKKGRDLDVIIIGDASGGIEKRLEVNGKMYPRQFGKFLQKLDPNGLWYEPFEGYTEAPFIVYQPKESANELPVLVYINYEKNEELVNKMAKGQGKMGELANIIKDFDPTACERDKDGFCRTFNFKYSKKQFEQLKSVGQFNVLANADRLLKVLKTKFVVKSAGDDAGRLVMAAHKGNIKLVEKYAQKVIDLDARVAGVPGILEEDAITPLLAATHQGHYEIVVYLLEQGADVNASSQKGMTPLAMATIKNNGQIFELLLQHEATLSSPILRLAKDKPGIKKLAEEKQAAQKIGKGQEVEKKPLSSFALPEKTKIVKVGKSEKQKQLLQDEIDRLQRVEQIAQDKQAQLLKDEIDRLRQMEIAQEKQFQRRYQEEQERQRTAKLLEQLHREKKWIEKQEQLHIQKIKVLEAKRKQLQQRRLEEEQIQQDLERLEQIQQASQELERIIQERVAREQAERQAPVQQLPQALELLADRLNALGNVLGVEQHH